MLEEFLAAEILIIRVLEPSIAHDLVAEIEGVLENGEARHQPGRQRRPTDALGVHGAEFALQKLPVDRPRELRQRVV